ncbi:hypothetical protein JCM8097_001250 [Rhodosporidiobolus ruineniae]
MLAIKMDAVGAARGVSSTPPGSSKDEISSSTAAPSPSAHPAHSPAANSPSTLHYLLQLDDDSSKEGTPSSAEPGTSSTPSTRSTSSAAVQGQGQATSRPPSVSSPSSSRTPAQERLAALSGGSPPARMRQQLADKLKAAQAEREAGVRRQAMERGRWDAAVKDLEAELASVDLEFNPSSSTSDVHTPLEPSHIPPSPPNERHSCLTLTSSSSDPNLLPFSAHSTSSAFSSSSRAATPTPSPALRSHYSVPALHLTSPSHLSPFQFSSATTNSSTGPVCEAAFEPQGEPRGGEAEGSGDEEKEDGEEKEKQGEGEGEGELAG